MPVVLELHEDGGDDGDGDDEVRLDVNAGQLEKRNRQLKAWRHVACFRSYIWEHLHVSLPFHTAKLLTS
jgi:hypothetical protein